jgi:seryl-tRNA synthetase
LGEKLKIIDFKRGAKLAGSRFYVQVGCGARLERALINFMLDQHVNNHGYTEMQLPSLVTQDVMEGSGNLPKFGDDLYRDNPSELWMIPTAEVPLTGLHREEILPPGSLPKYYTSFTQCFRREKTAAGRDTRGIKRVHQFNKVELYKFVEPSTAAQEFEKLVNNAEQICRLLELPYRVLELCTGDLGFASSKTFDIEVWAPGSQEWLEVSSCSNCADFQSRRSNIRYRPKDRVPLIFPYTLNGSGLALPRVIIALLENGQQEDGSISLPDALHPYTGFTTITEPQG